MYEIIIEITIMKITTHNLFPRLPFPNDEPQNFPVWQNAFRDSRVHCPQGHLDLEETLYRQWEIVLRWIVKLK